jgi:hypothetical protein
MKAIVNTSNSIGFYLLKVLVKVVMEILVVLRPARVIKLNTCDMEEQRRRLSCCCLAGSFFFLLY